MHLVCKAIEWCWNSNILSVKVYDHDWNFGLFWEISLQPNEETITWSLRILELGIDSGHRHPV